MATRIDGGDRVEHVAPTRFRDDIEGLRGIAVSLVVLFHVGLHSVAGGYIGVDVFFVISGYLISAQLVREIETHGRVRFADFWARRFRRLMPLLLLTLVATAIIGLVVYSPLFWQQLARESVASTLYISNIHFAQSSSFYFQSGTSPLLHTWSLSVEEQFYAVWPLLIAFVGWCAHRLGLPLRRTLFWSIAVASAGSFVVALLLVRRGSPWAFFSGPSRAWEFGVGAVSYLAVRRCGRIDLRIRQAALCIGVAAIVGAAVLFDEFTEMPGVAATLPVAGSALILIADAGSDRGVGRVMSSRVLRTLGRVSYGWYLFHWPAIVLVAAQMQRPSVTAATFAALASLGLAWLATRFVESPVRGARRLRRPRSMLLATAVAIVVMIGAGQLIEAGAQRRLAEPSLARLLDAREQRSETGSGDCVEEMLADGTVICVYGTPDSPTTVLLLGDSHAAQWAPAFEAVARQEGVRLIVRTRGGCPAIPVYVARTGDDRVSFECQAFRAASQRLVAELRPTLVVVASADFTGRLLSAPEGRFLDRSQAMRAWSIGAEQFAQMVADSGSSLAVIEDNPRQEREPIECLARGFSFADCSVSSARAVPAVEERSVVEQAAFESVAPVTVFRTVPLICDAVRCAIEIDGVVVYSDNDHLSAEFVMQQVARVSAFVADALSGGR